MYSTKGVDQFRGTGVIRDHIKVGVYWIRKTIHVLHLGLVSYNWLGRLVRLVVTRPDIMK